MPNGNQDIWAEFGGYPWGYQAPPGAMPAGGWPMPPPPEYKPPPEKKPPAYWPSGEIKPVETLQEFFKRVTKAGEAYRAELWRNRPRFETWELPSWLQVEQYGQPTQPQWGVPEAPKIPLPTLQEIQSAWEKAYGRATETKLQTIAREFGERYPEGDFFMPGGFEDLAGSDAPSIHSWLEGHPFYSAAPRYGEEWETGGKPVATAIFDMEGNPIAETEARSLYQTEAFKEVVKVYAMGGGKAYAIPMQLWEALGEKGPREVGFPPWGEAKEEQTRIAEIARAGLTELQALILKGIETEQKRVDVYNAYQKAQTDIAKVLAGIGQAPGDVEFEDARVILTKALPEDVKGVVAEAKSKVVERGLERWVPSPPEAKPFDVEAFRTTLQPYGISVLDNYPYLTPISQALLLSLPVDVTRQMADYLADKGLAWRDFLEVSSSYFGGARMPMATWGIPRQWG